MKTLIGLALVTVLLATTSNRCFGLMGLRSITPAQAKEWGIIVQTRGNGSQVWVQLEFKATGELKDFSHVSLEISDGDKFLFGWSALQSKRLETGQVVTDWFLIDRDFLNKVTLRIVTSGGARDRSGNDLLLKDFVDLKNLDAPKTDKNAEAKSAPPAAAPATKSP